MATEPRSRRRRRKKILRKNDGSLYDATEQRRITPAELRDYVRGGGLFEARSHENGTDSTYEVLQDIVGAGFLQSIVPGLGGGPLSALGLGALGGGGPLSALGGVDGVANLVRILGEQPGRSDWDDHWEEPRRRTAGRRDAVARAEGEPGETARRRSWRDADDWCSEPAPD